MKKNYYFRRIFVYSSYIFVFLSYLIDVEEHKNLFSVWNRELVY
jgi:hypothetical protein